MSGIRFSVGFVGVGLISGDNLSPSFPEDLHAYLSDSAHTMNEYRCRHRLILVADTHALELLKAKGTRGAPHDVQVEKLVESLSSIVSDLSRSLLLPIQLVRASSLMQIPRYGESLKESTASTSNIYLAHQMADLLYLNRMYGSVLKVGWSGSDSIATKQRDEYWFDRQFVSRYGKMGTCFYYLSGRWSAAQGTYLSPYAYSSTELDEFADE